MRKLKEPTSMRLSDRTKRLLIALSEVNDMTQTAVVEMAVREMAQRQNVQPKELAAGIAETLPEYSAPVSSPMMLRDRVE